MTFSGVLRKLREQSNLTQKDIAKHLGITRQAIASYELGKREPDYDILKKLADYFGVSVDYLLGRGSYNDENVKAVGMNIKLIRGSLSFEDFSEDIGMKMGILVSPEMLELYEKGERTPFSGTIKVLARYASVPQSFFYRHNTVETYEKERLLYQDSRQIVENDDSDSMDKLFTLIQLMDSELLQWVMDDRNLKYIKLAREIYDAGLSVDVFKPLLESLKGKMEKQDSVNITL